MDEEEVEDEGYWLMDELRLCTGGVEAHVEGRRDRREEWIPREHPPFACGLEIVCACDLHRAVVALEAGAL